MSKEIARAVEDAARKAEQGLAQDFSQAYHKVLKETEEKTAKVASNAAENEAATAQDIARATERRATGVPEPRGAAAGGGPGAGPGGASTPGGLHPPPEGPPWPARSDIPGNARGLQLRPPNKRHTVSGVKAGQVKGENSLILRGYEQNVNEDISHIAAGNAEWDPHTSRYSINGRSYGVEPTGTVFPAGGDGIVNLSRNEYSALKELIKAGGAPERVPAFTRAPHFVNDPQAVQNALDLYRRMFP